RAQHGHGRDQGVGRPPAGQQFVKRLHPALINAAAAAVDQCPTSLTVKTAPTSTIRNRTVNSASRFSTIASIGAPQRLSTKATSKKRPARVTVHSRMKSPRLNWKTPEAMVISLKGFGVSPLIRMTQ